MLPALTVQTVYFGESDRDDARRLSTKIANEAKLKAESTGRGHV